MPARELPQYKIRRSPRARHVHLRITPAAGIVVVLPIGFDAGLVPELLNAKRSWIDRKLSGFGSIDKNITPPNDICLKAVGKTWQVDYRPTLSSSVAARHTGSHLILKGAVEDPSKSHAAIKRWLARQAKHSLVPWLENLSQMHNLPFRNITVRGQKTRWGSCSSRQTISINYHLLFLDPHLVNCVLIHELCHTRHLNHGPAFWTLVEQFEPDYRQLHQSLRRAWEGLPGWAAQR